MNYDILLSRLAGVRRAPPTSGCSRAHRAFCPVHQHEGARPGRTPSLSVSEKTDDSVLVHCHAGCSVQEVLGAVGLQLSDLYPARTLTGRKGNSGPREWASAAALADALTDAAARVVVGELEAFEDLARAAENFKTAAWRAFRADERRAQARAA